MHSMWRGLALVVLWVMAAPVSGATRTVEFTTDEGTWMSVDVSPDGKSLVFDLLGRLYTMPIEGGAAKALATPDISWDFCPRFSPDGRQLSFLSNRAGFTDIWVMDLRTQQSRQVSSTRLWGDENHDSYNMACTPRWMPGGQALLAHDIVRSGRWFVYAVSAAQGADRAVKLAPVEGFARASTTAALPLDGGQKAIVAYTLWGKENNRRDLFWLNLSDGTAQSLREAGAPGHAFSPELSRSQRWLAYIRRNSKNDSELRIRDLRNGADRRLLALTEVDEFVQETELPSYAFTPDEQSIVIAFAGKLHRVALKDGAQRVIPFDAKVVRTVTDRIRADQRIEDGPVRLRAQRWPQLSPDRKTLVFSSGGSVWVRALPDGKAREWGGAGVLNTMAALSPDGRRVAYVSFGHTADSILNPGKLLVRAVDRKDAVHAIDDDASYYWPTWSPDGKKLAVVRRSADGKQVQLGWLDVSRRSFHAVTAVDHYLGEDFRGAFPRWLAWSGDGKSLLFQDFREWKAGFRAPVKLESIGLDGSGRRTLAQAQLDIYGIIPSPDLRHAIVIGWDQNAYVAELGETSGETPKLISLDMPGIQRISEVGALYPYWADSHRLVYGWMERVFEYRLGQSAPSEVSRTELSLPRRQGQGLTALRNARLITMAGDSGVGRVIERGTVLIDDRRIAAIGAVEEVKIPAGARVIDASGMTIMPGLVDTHYHGVDPETLSFYTPGEATGGDRTLAFGITTPFEPGGGSIDDSSEDWRVLLETGRIRGPRWRFDSINDVSYLHPNNVRESLEEIRQRLRRKHDLGQGPCLKEIADRDSLHSRWTAQAASEQGVCIVAHVEDNPFHSLSRIAYGMALHHNTMPVPAYRDVTQFLSGFDVSWTPHMELQWDIDMPKDLQPHDAHPQLFRRLDAILDAEDRQRLGRYFFSHERYGPMIEKYRGHTDDLFARSRRPELTAVAKKLLADGVHMSLSGHDRFGPLRGEMFVWQEGGIDRARILRAATLGGAQQLGYQRDLGSLEVGKIADLIVLKANPLEDVLNTIRLKWTVIDGLVYDSGTLEPVTTKSSSTPPNASGQTK